MNEYHKKITIVFSQVFPVLAAIIFLFIAYHAKAGVDEIRDNDIIKFLNRIYIKLGQ